MNYYLKHKDTDVAFVSFIETEESASRFSCMVPEASPFMRQMTLSDFNLWWKYRRLPDSRPHITELLRKQNVSSSSALLRKNLGLSLDDCYWLCPAELPLQWDDVNLFREAEKVLSKSFTDYASGMEYIPRAGTTGNMPKDAMYDNGCWYLHKYSSDDGQQTVNEKFPEQIHQSQAFTNYVRYQLIEDDNGLFTHSVCPYFTDEHTELIPAFYLLSSESRKNDESEFEQYIRLCKKHGIDEDTIRNFMDYQTAVDFLITNTDRHFRNFGILRNPDTLEFIGPAPIFDNGNSMFFTNSRALSRMEILKLTTSGFYSAAEKTLKTISNKNVIDTALLPTPDCVADFYKAYHIDNGRADVIAANYSHKLSMYREFQQGKTTSVYYEKLHSGISLSSSVSNKAAAQEKQTAASIFVDCPDAVSGQS